MAEPARSNWAIAQLRRVPRYPGPLPVPARHGQGPAVSPVSAVGEFGNFLSSAGGHSDSMPLTWKVSEQGVSCLPGSVPAAWWVRVPPGHGAGVPVSRARTGPWPASCQYTMYMHPYTCIYTHMHPPAPGYTHTAPTCRTGVHYGTACMPGRRSRPGAHFANLALLPIRGHPRVHLARSSENTGLDDMARVRNSVL